MKLAAYLKSTGTSQRDFARAVGVADNSVSQWISGRNLPRGKTLARIEELSNGAVRASDFGLCDPAPEHDAPTPGEVASPLAQEAQSLGIDVAKVTEASLRKAISDEKARRWNEEHREAIKAWTRWVEENGLPLEKYRMF